MGEMAEWAYQRELDMQLKLERELVREHETKRKQYLQDVVDKVWTTSDGTRIPIPNMDDKHLANSRRLIILNNWRTEFLPSIEWEINKRELLKKVQAVCAG